MYICLFVFLLLSSPFPQATAWGNSQEIMKHLCNLSFQAQVPFSKLWGSQWQMLGWAGRFWGEYIQFRKLKWFPAFWAGNVEMWMGGNQGARQLMALAGAWARRGFSPGHFTTSRVSRKFPGNDHAILKQGHFDLFLSKSNHISIFSWSSSIFRDIHNVFSTAQW